jgi:serine/threonine protein kinase
VHGDVKLDNVLLKTDPAHVMGFVPKLSDFGLARVLSNPDDNLRQHIFNQTGAGGLIWPAWCCWAVLSGGRQADLNGPNWL